MLGFAQNVCFISVKQESNEMKVEFKTMKYFLCTMASFYKTRHHSFTNSVG
jgi:hypothetical protein